MRSLVFLVALYGLLFTTHAFPAVVDLDSRASPKPATKPAPAPKPAPPAAPALKEIPCDPISKYSVAWFMANACVKPKASTCLFYTRGLSAKARSYAKAHNPPMTTIWDLWDARYYDTRRIKTNPLRCIFTSPGKKDQATYFNNMSTAMASMCDVFATVMDANITPAKKTFDTVTQSGIWFKSEYPTLRNGLPNLPPKPVKPGKDPKPLQPSGKGDLFGKKVDMIEAISVDGKTAFTYWKREGLQASKRADRDERMLEEYGREELGKRATCAKVSDAIVALVDDSIW